MTSDEKIQQITHALEESCEDPTVPKNIKLKFQEIISLLNDSHERSIKVNRILHDLDEISDDTNLQPYIRTQIWNIVSMLEKV